MTGDFINFTILYISLFLTMALIGNLNFMYHLSEFENIFTASLTVINASIGNYDIEIFNTIKNTNMRMFGQFYMVVVIVCFNLLLFNLFIAVLGNTYNMYDMKSNGLYLSKILSKRDELIYDENYGGFLTSIPPINAVVLPFIPLGMIIRTGHPMLIKLNQFLMQI